MAYNELYPTSTLDKQTDPNQLGSSRFDNFRTAGSVLLSGLREQFQNGTDLVSNVLEPTGKKIALLGSTIALSGGAVLTSESPATAMAPDSPIAHASATYPDVMSSSVQSRINRLAGKCLKPALLVNSQHSIRVDEPIKRNKDGVLWLKRIENDTRKKVSWKYRSGRTFCGAYVTTADYGAYFPKPTRKTSKGGYFIDPYLLTNKDSIVSFTLFFKKKS
jgi:hypothetical protein